jgi:ABC-type branched-subunit amino acid transport system permease subunit
VRCCRPLDQRSKLGTLLLAMRDKEDRVRFSGYDVAMFKVFVFCRGDARGVGGAMFTLQVGFMSPSFVGIVPSIEMVIYAAVGGRMSLVGAVYGALLVNSARPGSRRAFRTSGCSDGGDVHRRGDGVSERAGGPLRRACARACGGCSAWRTRRREA